MSAEVAQAEQQAVIEFGLKTVEHLPWSDLNAVTQTRKTYSEEHLMELERAIEAIDSAGQPRNEMIHPLLVNVLDAEHVEPYLTELNRCHGTSHTAEQLNPNSDGKFVVVVAGHRRRLATGRLIERYGADPERSLVACSVFFNLKFDEALDKQIFENISEPLPPYQQARAIQAKYQYGLATGAYKGLQDCVKALPFGETKIRGALRYCELPVFLQDLVEDGRMSYGAAVALHPLIGAYDEYHGSQLPETRAQIVDERLLTMAIKIIDNGWGVDRVSEIVRGTLGSLKEISDNDLVLFSTDYLQVARTERQRVSKELFSGGINRLRSFMSINDGQLVRDLPSETREALETELKHLLKKLGGVALPEVVDQLEFE